ncbi:MAG TPA: glycoside hydrolase family 27 protein [Terriglobia bacterium]|nr:glycoside hydrolase family 27 protein [Terriglobia bacterium]
MTQPKTVSLALSCAVALLVLSMNPANAFGQTQPPKLASVPPMGWNTWYAFGCHISADVVRAQVDQMVANGMKAAGYRYVNLDDCWQGSRDAQGVIHPNSHFPDVKALADYVHAHTFLFGIYSSPGPKTCGGYEGSYRHEEQDARTYAGWGVDFLKYDWCSATSVYRADQMEGAYLKMHQAMVAAGRPMIYSLCQYGMLGVWRWGPQVGAELWRTTGDVSNKIDFQEYERMVFVGFGQAGLEPFAGPGRWNDPDMLQIGNHGLNLDEQKTQMSLWCLLAAPLIVSTDLTKLSREELGILTNPEMIKVDQDPLGIEGHRVSQEGPVQVWAKPESGGEMAIGLFNSGESSMPVSVDFNAIGFSHAVHVRDLWAHKNLGTFEKTFSTTVHRHGVVIIGIR